MIAQFVISLEFIVQLVIYLIIAAGVFGLLFWLISYIEVKFPSVAPFADFARIILVVFAVLILIGILLALGGHPLLVIR